MGDERTALRQALVEIKHLRELLDQRTAELKKANDITNVFKETTADLAKTLADLISQRDCLREALDLRIEELRKANNTALETFGLHIVNGNLI
jgi:hypothetical protein